MRIYFKQLRLKDAFFTCIFFIPKLSTESVDNFIAWLVVYLLFLDCFLKKYEPALHTINANPIRSADSDLKYAMSVVDS